MASGEAAGKLAIRVTVLAAGSKRQAHTLAAPPDPSLASPPEGFATTEAMVPPLPFRCHCGGLSGALQASRGRSPDFSVETPITALEAASDAVAAGFEGDRIRAFGRAGGRTSSSSNRPPSSPGTAKASSSIRCEDR